VCCVVSCRISCNQRESTGRSSVQRNLVGIEGSNIAAESQSLLAANAHFAGEES
jgi:hypothetical protein